MEDVGDKSWQKIWWKKYFFEKWNNLVENLLKQLSEKNYWKKLGAIFVCKKLRGKFLIENGVNDFGDSIGVKLCENNSLKKFGKKYVNI